MEATAMGKGIPAGWRIRVMLPVRGRLQQYRLHAPVTFCCDRCKRDRSTAVVATLEWDWSKPVREDCYAALSETADAEPIGPIVMEPWKPSVPEPRKPRVEETTRPAAPVQPAKKGEERRGSPTALRTDFKRLAVILRNRAAGAKLKPQEQQALVVHADAPVFPVALRYAELLDEGDAMVCRHSGRPVPTSVKALTQQRIDAVRRFEARHGQRMAQARRTGGVSDRLSHLMVRELAGKKFEQEVASVLRERGLRPDALVIPTARLWSWLAHATGDRAAGVPILPKAVRHLLAMHDEAFVQAVIADAKGTRPEPALEHPAVVERWAACSGEVESRFRSARDQCDRALRRMATKAQRGSQIGQLRALAQAYALASARHLMASLSLKALQLQVLQTYGEERSQRFRTSVHKQAVEAVYRADPALGAEVAKASEEHRRTCPRWSPQDPCLTCAPQVAAVVRTRLSSSSPTSARLEPPSDKGQQSEAIACAGGAESFVCRDIHRHLAASLGRMVGVTEAVYEETTGRYGYSWLTEHGEWGTGQGRAASLQDAWLQAVCRTALELGGDVSRVQVLCRDERAASVATHVVKANFIADALGFPVTDETRTLLMRLIRRRGKVSVAATVCSEQHRSITAAGRLASLALAAREAGGTEAIKAAGNEIAEELRARTETRDGRRPEERGWARWVPGGYDAGELRWQAALRRVHLMGGWTELPEGLAATVEDRRMLRLVVDHPGRKTKGGQRESEVLLRRTGGRWELHGVVWPRGMLPGTVITYRWRPNERLIRARSELLPQPERIDQLTYQHRYDIRVVTRENAPGAEQDVRRHELSDSAWVMRTLRILGHLSPDGSAILAEDALLRNCLELGLPQKRAARIHPAVKRLVQERRIGRVRGSLDANGQPSHPPRRNETAVQLLRYVPRLERIALAPPPRRETPPHGREEVVSGFVRRLPAGREASEEQRELHQEAVRAKQVVNRPLPEGYTFVRSHRRKR
ncbi:hypothetical protein AB0875_15185 [Micromonospora gifhornensis]|uniref:hypothetical protein n=1 Tax=Micromonospora gifhornensis TaxID=84594 RepID=UPI003453251B